MDDEQEIVYLKMSIKELVNECADIELLYLISSLLKEDAVN